MSEKFSRFSFNVFFCWMSIKIPKTEFSYYNSGSFIFSLQRRKNMPLLLLSCCCFSVFISFMKILCFEFFKHWFHLLPCMKCHIIKFIPWIFFCRKNFPKTFRLNLLNQKSYSILSEFFRITKGRLIPAFYKVCFYKSISSNAATLV